MFSSRPLISKSSCPFNNPSVTVPRAPITTGINFTFMFHIFPFPSRVNGFFLFIFFLFYSVVLWRSKVYNFAIYLVSVCMSKLNWDFYVSFSGTDPGLCPYYLFACSNINFLRNSQWMPLPTHFCLVFLC